MYSHAPVSTNGKQVVGPTGIDARREARRVARCGTRPRAARACRGDVRRVDHRDDRARHDVLARREDALEVLHRFARPEVGGRGVADAVGVEREQARRRRWSRARRSARARRARPRRAPALSGECTHSPTSSRSGWRSMQRNACRPTLPVLHWMTRYLGSCESPAAFAAAIVASRRRSMMSRPRSQNAGIGEIDADHLRRAPGATSNRRARNMSR